MLMEAPPGVPTPMNLGNPREVTVRRTAELVAGTLGVFQKIEFRPRPEDDPMQRSPDIQRARRYLHWSPRVPFERGLAETLAYFRSQDLTPPRRHSR